MKHTDSYPLDSLKSSDKEIPLMKDIVAQGSSKRKILFMDDQPYIRHMVANMLTYLGYEVELAINGSEAVEKYKNAKEAKKAFDAVILDLTVPGEMGGECAVQRLLDIDPDVKAIISSGYPNKPIITEYERYGFSGAVIKPYTINELSETLSRVITGNREEALYCIKV